MASRLLLGRIQSAGRLSGGHGRLLRLSFSGGEGLRRPLPRAGDRMVCSNAYGQIKTDTRITDHEPHLDRFSDPQVAQEDRRFIQFLDRMLDATRNPQSLAQIQRGRMADGLSTNHQLSSRYKLKNVHLPSYLFLHFHVCNMLARSNWSSRQQLSQPHRKTSKSQYLTTAFLKITFGFPHLLMLESSIYPYRLQDITFLMEKSNCNIYCFLTGSCLYDNVLFLDFP